jgi:hypothetical protein
VLYNGELISKARVDRAKELLARLDDAYRLENLTDEELFVKGDKIEATLYYKEKYGCSLWEAKTAIENIRNEK